MSNEKETPEAVEAARRFEEDMELINRARNEVAAESIETPREREIADFMASIDPQKDLSPLTINSRAARSSSAARKQKAGMVQ